MRQVKVIVCRVGQPAVVEEIDDTLEAMQSIVGGFLEGNHLEPGLLLMCHEDGKWSGLPPNRPFPPNPADIVCGDFFISRYGPQTGNTVNVTKADIKKWIKHFK